nr:aromatic ring-hydroxylating dioxygenase subunit alpha [Paracidovorax wautersii]
MSQLPVQAYFSDELLKQEDQQLFRQGPQYEGHVLLVPELNDYCVLPHRHNGMTLFRGAHGVQLISNVCRHRQATILQGRGNAKRISCPLHRWTYGTDGSLLTAPRFETKPCLALETFPTATWNGLHFTGAGLENAVAGIPSDLAYLLSFDDMHFGHMEVHECNYNWKTFIEFYLEDYHVAPFHPGLGRFVSCDDLQWSFGKLWSMQTVGFHKGLLQPGDSEVYRGWHEAVLRYHDGQLPAVGAMWFLLYPNLMIERYPLVTVISTVHPRGPLRSVNVVEYYHPNKLRQFTDGARMAELAAEAYLETAVEDNEIGERMQEGRYALMCRGSTDAGPYHERLEAGMAHFHRYLREQMGDACWR